MVGDRREHDVGHGRDVGGGDDRRQRPLGRIPRAGLDEAPVPDAEPVRRGPVPQREQREPRWAAPGVAGHEGEAGHQRQGAVCRVEVRQDVGHGGQDRQPRTPARLPVAGAELHARPHDGPGGHPGVEKRQHRLGHDQRDALLQLGQPIGLRGHHDDDTVAVDLHRVGADVVGPGIERSPGAQVEAGVVPVARHQAALDRAPVEREPHVRAAVVEGERCTVAPEDADGLGTGLARQATGPLQLVERSDRDAVVHGVLRCREALHCCRLIPGAGLQGS